MSKIDFSSYSDTPLRLRAYDEFIDGVYPAFDSDDALVLLRKQVDCLILDCANFSDTWFGLEIKLPRDFRALSLRMRAYPMAEFYPRVYHSNGTVDLLNVEISDAPFDLTFSREHLRGAGLPEGAIDVKLALLVPSSNWFVLGLHDLEITHA
ncbi:hypothetical protein GCM10007939_18220 [Amylibacter marinus]|uniref:Uncharacterized protein n=1 Tax=Amylibacter marinus TaxID=1475483 RepID=A0ABQ5VWM4_9RHOB|nr:hypothetical protein [Amylibacter marinus]GLQ35539.1 hypothetical protein GCM10007939_18220 [Amylibacter marinus]